MMKKIAKFFGILMILAVVLGVGYHYWGQSSSNVKLVYRTEEVVPRDLVSTISATGTVEPEDLVNVGAQVGGMITTFGKDADGKPVNYGSRVTSGMVLAQIDPLLYQADAEQAAAAVLQSEAAVKSAEATIKKSKAEFELANLTWARYCKLNPSGAISRSEYDSAKTAVDTTAAAVVLAEASLLEANAKLRSAKASLDRANYNLKYCVITSPVDGVIIDRRVNIGQTVVSSMSAPSLFLIAKDLKKMQVWVSVNEADVGAIKPGLPVEFSVDAFGSRKFTGVVQKIRLNATMSQNVVTYVVEVGTDNSDGTLLPYLTANVKFITDERKGVSAVPNAALRWAPEGSTVVAPEGRSALWSLNSDGNPQVHFVETGMNSGSYTEISGGVLPEGTRVITSAQKAAVLSSDNASQNNAGSPFMPKPPKRAGAKK